jgi:hypothetical protein
MSKFNLFSIMFNSFCFDSLVERSLGTFKQRLGWNYERNVHAFSLVNILKQLHRAGCF